MPATVIADSWLVAVHYTFIGTQVDATNVLCVRPPAGTVLDATTSAALALDVRNVWDDATRGWKLVSSNGWQQDRVRITDVRTPTGPSIEVSHAVPVIGVSANPPVTPNCAVCITLRTAKRGKSYRGRIYLPGCVEGNVDGQGNLAAGAVTSYQLFATFLRDYFTNTSVYDLAVGSRLLATSEVVTSALARGRIDTQRRRLPRE